jgi:hypothetical protein
MQANYFIVPRFLAFAALFTLLSPLAAQVWRPIPLVRQDILDAGFAGGEGAQRPQMVAVDGTDGSVIYYGTDVGGLFRSTDGGAHFSPANIGLETCGIVGIAVDPLNKNRALAIGDGGGNFFNTYGGVYLTTNQGATWSRRLSRELNAVGTLRQNGREQVTYARSSFNSSLGYCEVAYWVSESDRKTTANGSGVLVDPNGSLYKSIDGGVSWVKIADDDRYGGADDARSLIKVHPTLGIVYIANKNGFYRSTNGGLDFTRTQTGNVRSLDVVAAQPNNVWISIGSTIYKSTDSGQTFLPLAGTGIANVFRLKVSPANPNNMVAMNSSNWNRYYSTNGGASWALSTQNNSLSWIPGGAIIADRSPVSAWHPTNENIVWSLGKGDQLLRSNNKGVSFSWASNGINGIACISSFNFNTQNPDITYLGFLDYNSALTTNRGRTWKYINLSINNADNDAFGWVYGGYAKDANVMFGGNRAFNPATGSLFEEFELWITFDGGLTSVKKADNLSGIQVSFGHPNNPNILFCWNRRSSDGGQTWSVMNGCSGVFTYNTSSGKLFGASGANVVSSNDGVNWTVVTTLPANVTDIAVDSTRGRLYVAASNRKLYRCDSINMFAPVEITGTLGCPVKSVATDPNNPSIVYAAGTLGTFRKLDNSVIRSTDAGVTWSKLNNRTDLGADGGNCAEWVRVHPVTSEAWVTTNCFGVWRFGSPDLTLAADAEARRVGTGDGGGTVGALTTTELFIGNAINRGSAYSPVYAFLLPNLGAVAAPFSSATFTVGLSTSTSTFNGYSADVYGLTARSAPDILGSDAFAGANDTTGAVKLQDNWINFNQSTAVSTGIKTLSNASLVNYLNAQYANGAGAGKYVFLRISPDTGGNIFKNVRFAASEYTANVAWRPKLVVQ